MSADAWPLAVDVLVASGKPWPEELCYFDLRWLYDRKRGRLPGRPALARRWNVSDRTARRILADVEGWWDPAKGVQPASNSRPTRVQRASNERPTTDSANADNLAKLSSSRPTSVQPASNERPTDVHTRVESQPQPQPQPPSGVEKTSRDVHIPNWVDAWRRGARGLPSVRRADLVRLVVAALETITGRPGSLSPGYGRPVLNAWRRLGYPEFGPLEVGDDPLDADPSTAIGAIALLARACRECPAPEFRNDVRGVRADGQRWRDPPKLTPQVVLRLDPKSGSQGATIETRLEVARRWHADGCPVIPDHEPTAAAPPVRATQPAYQSFSEIFASWDEAP